MLSLVAIGNMVDPPEETSVRLTLATIRTTRGEAMCYIATVASLTVEDRQACTSHNAR